MNTNLVKIQCNCKQKHHPGLIKKYIGVHAQKEELIFLTKNIVEDKNKLQITLLVNGERDITEWKVKIADLLARFTTDFSLAVEPHAAE